MISEVCIPQEFISVDFKLICEIEGKMGDEDTTLYRYQRANVMSLFGEHISFVISHQGQLKGFVKLTEELVTPSKHLPSTEHACDVAREFLKSYASDLLDNMEIHWIRKHDEKIIVNDVTKIVSGMKVKCRNMNNGKYFWVVVGDKDEVIIFERDIVWDFIRAGRQTEKWLHDSWLKSKL